MTEKKLTQNTLSTDAFWMTNKYIGREIGLYEASILAELIFKDKMITAKSYSERTPEYRYTQNKDKKKKYEGYFHSSMKSLEESFNKSADTINRYIANIKKAGFIDVIFKDMPKRRFFKINHESINLFLSDGNTNNKSPKNKVTSDLKKQPLYNNKKSNNKIVSKDTITDAGASDDRKSSSLNSEKKFTIPIEIEEIIVEAIKLGGFSNHLSFRKTKKKNNPTNVIKIIIRTIKEINSGAFFRNRNWNDSWLKKQNIKRTPPIRGYNNYTKVKKIILKSAERLGVARSLKKEYVPDSMVEFFYNPDSKKSRFLYFLNNEIMTTTDLKTKGQIKMLPDTVRSIVEKYYKDSPLDFSENQLLQFWSNMNNICSWHKKFGKRLLKYNLAYHDGNWGYHCKYVENFFLFVVKYLEQQGTNVRCRPIPVDKHNSYWQRFQEWLLVDSGIQTEIDEKKEKYADEEIKRREEDRFEIQVSDEMTKIERECDENHIEVPSFAIIRAKAKERVREEELMK